MSAARKAAWADPAVRAKMDWLAPQQISEIVDEIKRGVRPYVDIAEDWLVSLGTIARIAREAGAQRRPRKARAPHPEMAETP
jgi:hypothetical protein